MVWKKNLFFSKLSGPFRQFVAYIDPDNKFTLTDKLSQVE